MGFLGRLVLGNSTDIFCLHGSFKQHGSIHHLLLACCLPCYHCKLQHQPPVFLEISALIRADCVLAQSRMGNLKSVPSMVNSLSQTAALFIVNKCVGRYVRLSLLNKANLHAVFINPFKAEPSTAVGLMILRTKPFI